MAASAGMTYERSAILKHLDTQRHDPCTRHPLRRRHLSPNLALRGVIESWVAAQCKARCPTGSAGRLADGACGVVLAICRRAALNSR